MRLYCLPFAGGGAPAFRPLANLVPPWIEVRAVQLPGRLNRRTEPAFTACAPLVSALADGLHEEFAEAPFALFGHSMGALLAIELTHELRRRGLAEPCRIGVSGWAPPGEGPERKPLHHLPDDELVDALQTFGGMPPQVLEHPDLVAFVLPAIRADFTLLDTHEPSEEDPPLDQPLSVFGGMDDSFVPAAVLDAWRRHSRSPVTVHVLPGGHFFLLGQMHQVAQAIAGDMRAAAAVMGP